MAAFGTVYVSVEIDEKTVPLLALAMELSKSIESDYPWCDEAKELRETLQQLSKRCLKSKKR